MDQDGDGLASPSEVEAFIERTQGGQKRDGGGSAAAARPKPMVSKEETSLAGSKKRAKRKGSSGGKAGGEVRDFDIAFGDPSGDPFGGQMEKVSVDGLRAKVEL
eukprot:7360337-Prymnesium_polylepis.1